MDKGGEPGLPLPLFIRFNGDAVPRELLSSLGDIAPLATGGRASRRPHRVRLLVLPDAGAGVQRGAAAAPQSVMRRD